MTEPMHRLVQQVEPVQDQDIILTQKLLHKSGAHQFIKFRFQVVILVLRVQTIQQ
jgi:uncharacterized protein YbcV (DUF1398 family)